MNWPPKFPWLPFAFPGRLVERFIIDARLYPLPGRFQGSGEAVWQIEAMVATG
jgi:hypothetical protein